MKKKFKSIVLVSLLTLCFAACGGDDGDGVDNSWKENTTDVAVTGSATKVTFYGAFLEGVVNLDRTQTLSSNRSVSIYIEYAEAEYYESKGYFNFSESIGEIVGNKISATLDDLTSNTRYLYRTKVEVNGVTYVGETRSFTTAQFTNIVNNVSITEVTETAVYFSLSANAEAMKHTSVGIFYSKSADDLKEIRPYQLSEASADDNYDYDTNKYFDGYASSGEKKYLKDGERHFKIENLQPGITYYYCFYSLYGRGGDETNDGYITGGISSFTTKGQNNSYNPNDGDDNGGSDAAVSVVTWSQITGTWFDESGSPVVIYDDGRMVYNDGTTWNIYLQEVYPQSIVAHDETGFQTIYEIYYRYPVMYWTETRNGNRLVFRRR
ncbi:MAG: hypothetical protein IJV19_06610 [Prevotella sp.]|nr:hypothetical protein [Prevotella sp.]